MIFSSIVIGSLGVTLFLALYIYRQTRSEDASSHSPQAPSSIPGWNRQPAEPILGDLGVALQAGSLYQHLQQEHQYGKRPVFAFWWKGERVVSICSPKSFKETEHLFNRPSKIFDQCKAPLQGWNSIQSVNDDEWKRQGKEYRGKVRGDYLELYFDDFLRVAQETEHKWSTGTEINLMKDMFRMTLKGILSTLLGNIFEDDNEKIDEIANLYHFCKSEMDERILDSPPPESQREHDFQTNLKLLQNYLQQLIDAGKTRDKNDKIFPLMEALVECQDSDKQMSNITTFMGGFHTASYYMTWLLYFLAQNPEVQDKLLVEITESVGNENGDKLKDYVMSSKTYLRQVLDEALRKSITAPQTAHYCDDDIVVEGYLIPAKTPIIQVLGVAMHNADNWKCPQKFDPSRFSPDSEHAKRDREFRPFGVSNSRRCPANHFTYLMAAVFVTVLLRSFVFSTAINSDNGQQEDNVKRKYGIATSPDSEISFCVTPRI